MEQGNMHSKQFTDVKLKKGKLQNLSITMGAKIDKYLQKQLFLF
jgi:hypothetical protein